MRQRLLKGTLVLITIALVSILPTPERSADASVLMFGNGSGGPVVFSVNTVFSPPGAGVVLSAAAGNSNLTVSVASGTLAMGDAILIHQTRGAGAGSWELNEVQSYALGNIVTATPLLNSYTTGGPNAAQVIVVPQFSALTVSPGVLVSAKAWNGATGGIFAVLVNGTATVDGTIDATGDGYRGGAAGVDADSYQGEGGPGMGARSSVPNGNGGGGANGATPLAGGGGGNGTPGSPSSEGGNPGAAGGLTVGTSDLSVALFGGGGGGSAGSSAQCGGGRPGGNGGGIIALFAKDVDLGQTALISANGNSGASDGEHGSGGGAGGSILIRTENGAFGNGTIRAMGGAGGIDHGCTCCTSENGGAGGVGRLRVEYCSTITGGTADPPASIAQIGCAPMDTDGDGMPDTFEASHPCLSPTIADASFDADGDGLTSIVEMNGGTDPCNPDTDGDGYNDGMEVGLAKAPLTYCAIMRADVDGSGKVTISDLSTIAGQYNKLVPPAPARLDQGPPPFDNKITITDLSKAAGVYNQFVSACP